MDRRRLQCFVALAEELHFRRAAERCHISQPGLSQQLRQLEGQLRVQLLYRSKRRVSLTRAGEVFLVEARKILRAMDQGTELARQTESGVIGQLFVGTTASALFIVLPEIMTAFRAAFPRVNVTIEQMTTAEQEQALAAGDIHVGLVHTPLDDPALACLEMAEVPFDVVMAERNPLSRKPTLFMRDLAQERLILFPRQVGPRLYDEIIALCQQAGFSPESIVEAAPAQSIVAMAACDIGVGFVASRVQHYSRPLAVYRRLSGAAPRLTLGVAFLQEAVSPAVSRFVEMAVAAGRDVR